MYSLFKFPPYKPSLAQIDDAFRNTISKLPVSEQIFYCRGIISTLHYKLGHHNTKDKASHFRRHLDAAQRELQILYFK